MTIERDNMIIEDYLNNRPMVEIRREYGLSERRIFQILSKYGVTVSRKRKEKGAPPRPLSGLHQSIGRRLYDYYFEAEMERPTVAEKLGVSVQVVRRMELGAHNLDLFELQDIAAFMKISVGELLDGR